MKDQKPDKLKEELKQKIDIITKLQKELGDKKKECDVIKEDMFYLNQQIEDLEGEKDSEMNKFK